jgi:hypothetical protein
MELISLLNEARRAVPAVKFALGVAGIAAAVALVVGIIKSPAVAVFGTIIMLGLMFVLLVFSSIARKSRSAPTQIFAYVLTAFFVLMIMTTTFFLFTSAFFSYPRAINFLDPIPAATPSPPPSPAPMKTELEFKPILKDRLGPWADRAFLTAQASNGGIKESPSAPELKTQTWTTAQCLVGILSSPLDLNKYMPNIKAAFNYIERMRQPAPANGWNLFDNSNKYTVTEINSWVILAYIKSLESPTRIWNNLEQQEILDRIESDLAEIVTRQDSTGGWRPIKDNGPGFSRTYSTAMALWSLIEASRSSVVHQRIGNRYVNSIREGINWLIKSHITGLGWVPNPNRTKQVERFDGLTAQTLFVLSRAETLNDFKYVNNDQSYIDAQREFARNEQLSNRSINKDDSRVPDADTRFHETEFQAEGSTFLWFPWTLAELTHISNDKTLSSDDREAATQLRARILNANANKLQNYVESIDLMYLLGENLCGVSFYLDQVKS